jgi:hypothetical protein
MSKLVQRIWNNGPSSLMPTVRCVRHAVQGAVVLCMVTPCLPCAFEGLLWAGVRQGDLCARAMRERKRLRPHQNTLASWLCA